MAAAGPSYRGARAGTTGSWRNPWFDIASQYIPSTYKELFRWCFYLYSTNSIIAPIVNKKAAYVITELIYSSANDHQESERLWKEVLEQRMKIREFEFKMNLDYDIYGNAFASIYYPFERYFRCRSCEEISVSKKVKWIYDNHSFRGKCPKCKSETTFDAEDKTVKNRSRIRIIRWNPQYIDIRHNPFSDSSEYIYRIPKHIRKRVADRKQNYHIVSETPLEILEAIREKKNLLLDQSNIYHMKHPSPSGDDDAFGMPTLLPVFKDIWLLQVYRQAQEAVALDHVLPMTLLSPSTTPSGVSAHSSMNLNEWSRRSLEIVHRWRRDQNAIFTVPFPVTAQNIRGDAGALNVFNEINQVRDQIAGGLDIPSDFLYGNLCISISDGLISTSEGLLRPEELAPKKKGSKIMTRKIMIPGEQGSAGVLKFTHNVGKKKAIKITNGFGVASYPSNDHKYLRAAGSEMEWVPASDLKVGDQLAVRCGGELWGNFDNFDIGPTTMFSPTTASAKSLAALASGDDLDMVSSLTVMKDLLQAADAQLSEVAIPAEETMSTDDISAALRRVDSSVGLLAKMASCEVPSVVRKASRSVNIAYLEELFDGFDLETRAVVATRRLAEDVHAILLNFGIVSHVYENDGKFIVTAIGRDSANLRYLLGIDGPDHDDKVEPGSYQEHAEMKGVILVTVKDISNHHMVEMMDMTVGVTESFLLNGQVVHNSYSGSSISLRVLENLFLSRTQQLNNFLRDFVVPKVKNFLSLPSVDIRHRDFKMADDAQQKQIALSLRQTNTISDQTTVEELGFDYERETKRKREELKERNSDIIENARTQAEAQGIALQVSTEYQMKAQQAQQAQQPPSIPQGLRGMGKLGSIKEAADPGPPQAVTYPGLLEAQVQGYLKGPGNPTMKKMELASIQKDNPELFAAIKERLSLIKQQANDKFMRPLPVQKPPRRDNSPI